MQVNKHVPYKEVLKKPSYMKKKKDKVIPKSTIK